MTASFAARRADAAEPPRFTDLGNLQRQAHLARLSESPIWLALLHATGPRSAHIRDAGFLLSLPDFSAEAELDLTLSALYGPDSQQVCRFPARYFWLQRALDAPALSLVQCTDIEEFRRKAPLDRVALVFASENIAQPASMLGHALLKFSGTNQAGQQVSHAISFFTDAETINLPKLLFDSLIVGKAGFFSLSPFDEKQSLYVDVEQRNLWEYPLRLDGEQKELIRLHLIELKQTQLVYFFQSYNCATVLQFIISLSGKTLTTSSWWVSPKSLVKSAQTAGLVGAAQVTSPPQWLVRTLQRQVSVDDIQAIHIHTTTGDIAQWLGDSSDDPAFLRLKLAQAYNQYAYGQARLPKPVWQRNAAELVSVETGRFPGRSLQLDDALNPIHSPGENSLTFGIESTRTERRGVVTVLPVAHTLEDDNRGFGSESSLQLFATSIKVVSGDAKPRLERLVLYDMESLMPYQSLTGGFSGHFRVALEPVLNQALAEQRVARIAGSIGSTVRIGTDVDVFALGGVAVQRTGATTREHVSLEGGTVIRELWDMKTMLSAARTQNLGAGSMQYATLHLQQSKYLDEGHAVHLEYRYDFTSRYHATFLGASLTHTF